ncbi:hypothetical protein [uncultured Solobacterium sp.]|uniref:hypothetical protein n=1 Tax=uncultured Solobacterium sp. TaxID=747375 RepID=UPI0025D0955A|nr:hypothetical protein [uncultured Solobacterium sp.]
MKTDNQRREFEFALETVLKAADSKIQSVKINWDEKDTEFREAAKTVTVTYKNDYEINVNVEMDSWVAIIRDVLKQI